VNAFRAGVRAGTTLKTLLGAHSSKRVESFQPNTRPVRAQDAESFTLNFFSAEDLLSHSGERDGDANGEPAFSDTVHLFRPQARTKCLKNLGADGCKKSREPENTSRS
jgi:hypothetical protein